MAWHGFYSVEQTEAHVRDARRAVAENDLQRAFRHITSALTTDPLHSEWRTILDEVIRRSTDASELAPSDGQAELEFVSAAQRAWVSASKHDFKAAILFLARAAQLRPEAPMLLWAREWVRLYPAAATLDTKERLELMKATLPWVGVVPSPVRVDDARRPNLEALADLLVALGESYPKDALVLYAGGCVLRRLARFDEAIDLAHRAWQIEPTWNTTIGVACALRDSKHVDEAASWYRRALSIKPDELSPLLDLGDMFLDAERHCEAMAAYAQVLQRMPEHPWAEPSLLYTRLKKDAQPKDEGLLRQLAPTSDRARELLRRLEPRLEFFDHLPKPAGPAISALVELADALEREPSRTRGASVTVDIVYLESPSVLTAFRLWTVARGWSIDVTFNPGRIQQPDPRAPKGHVDFTLWAYEGTTARPLLAPPDARVHPPLAAIAKRPFHLASWEEKARLLAKQLGTAWIPQLACAMVHPPPLPSPKTNPFSWVLRCQIATALVVASTAAEEPWMLSTRRRALHALALGPTDWSTDAAIVVLAWTGANDPEARADVESLFKYLETMVPADGFTSWEGTLCNAWLSMGRDHDANRDHLTEWRRRLGEER